MNDPVTADAPEPTTTPDVETNRDTATLLAWLAEHDEQCPVCGYNLRALTTPVCPECRQDLALTVGAKRMRLGWWIVAMVPGFFSGIAAVMLAIPIVVSPLVGGGVPPLPFIVTDLFGWLSGVVAIALAARRVWFLRMSIEKQRAVALGLWGVHIAMFFGLLYLAVQW